jgi:hypothetical protein
MTGLGVLPAPGTGPLTFSSIDCPGANFTLVLGINAHGEVGGNCRTANDGKYDGFLLSGGSFTMIDEL